MHSTSSLDDMYLGSGLKVLRSIKKYGIENHTREILEYLPDRLALIDREREIVNEKLLKNSDCMNLMLGGQGNFSTSASSEGGKRRQSQITTEDRSKWQKENVKRQIASGTWINPSSRIASRKKISKSMSSPVLQFSLDGILIKRWEKMSGIAMMLGYPSQQYKITKCCKGVIPSALGFLWKYETKIRE